MLCVPTLRLLVAQVAVRMLPEPVSPTVAQPAIEAAPSLKFTVPVGAVPLTVAVKVTLVPAVEGVSELVLAPVTMTLMQQVLSIKLGPETSAASPKPPADPGVISTISVSSEP